MKNLAKMVLAVTFTLLLTMVLGGGSAWADDPDFGDVDDVLSGDYQIYAVDDLLIQRPSLTSTQEKTNITNYLLETEDLMFSAQSKRQVLTADCYMTDTTPDRGEGFDETVPQHTRAGRV